MSIVPSQTQNSQLIMMTLPASFRKEIQYKHQWFFCPACLTSRCVTHLTVLPVCSAPFRRYYQPPAAYDRQLQGLTGAQGKPLWMVLTLLLTIVGSSLGLAFGWATGCHWGLYAAMGGRGAHGELGLISALLGGTLHSML